MSQSSSTVSARLPDGFVHRGTQVTRLQAFVDAAFAFAVTLLVISIDAIPESIDDLTRALRGVPAFGVSFAMVALFWLAHARWSRRYGLEDTVSTLLSLSLVFLVLVFVYPLKMMFSSFMAWISSGRLSPDALLVPEAGSSAFVHVLIMFVIYGLVFVTLSACLLGLYLRAWQRRQQLALDGNERAMTLGEIYGLLWFVVVGVLSVLLAWLLMNVLPPDLSARHGWLVGLPGILYSLLGLTGVADALGQRRSRAAEPAR